MDVNHTTEVARAAAERLADRLRNRAIYTQPDVSSEKHSISSVRISTSQPRPREDMGPARGAQQKTLFHCFLQLPPELQLSILSRLDFGDIERLRRTCRLFRQNIDRNLIRSLFPDLKEELLATCYLCLSRQEAHAVVRAEESDARHPLSSRCFDCVAQRNGFTVGRKYVMGNKESVWCCRWCGIPVARLPAWNQPEFHAACFRKYNRVLLLYFLAGCAQWTLVITGSALCWHYFRDYVMVLAPTVVNFVLAFVVFGLSIMRGPSVRTFHWALIAELAILGLWVPPVYAVVEYILPTIDPPSSSALATLAFIGANMAFRLFNAIGNLILVFEWKMWRRKKPNTSLPQRIINKTMLVMVFWADPQSMEQEYPAIWWCRRGRRPRTAVEDAV